MKVLIYFVIAIASFATGYFLSAFRDVNHINEQIQFVQAEKVKQNLRVLKEIRSNIQSGCTSAANQLAVNEIDLNYMLLSEHVNLFPNGQFTRSLSDSDPKLLNKIKDYEINWGKQYDVYSCE